jgi:hypothetical protein
MARHEIHYGPDDQQIEIEEKVAALRGATKTHGNESAEIARSVVEVLDPQMEGIAARDLEKSKNFVEALARLYIPKYVVGDSILHRRVGILPGRRKLILNSKDGKSRTIVSYTRNDGTIDVRKITQREAPDKPALITFPHWKTVWKKPK